MKYLGITLMDVHFTVHHSRFEDKTKQVRFYLLFNFHLQFTYKSVGSLCPNSTPLSLVNRSVEPACILIHY